MEFNKSGSQILVQADRLALVLDGYEGTVQRIFAPSDGSAGISSCFTPDDQAVLMGTEKGNVEVFNVQSGTSVKTLEGHLGPVGTVLCNPKYAQIASSCTDTCLWVW